MVLGVLMLSGFFVSSTPAFAQTCTVTRATGDTYTGACKSSGDVCSSGQIGFIDGISGCSFATEMCCVTPPSGGFSCGTNSEKGLCKSTCGGDTPLPQFDYGSSQGVERCPSVSVSKCCKVGTTSGTCSGKDASGATQTGSCSTSATCSSGTALTGASGCTANGVACCYTPSGDGGGDGGTATACSGSENPGIVPCGRSCDNPATPDDETKICTLCHLLILIQNITNWILMVMTYIAFAVLVAMGILYIVSTGKPQLIGMAKNGIWAALVGFAIVLLGWVAINVILMVLADGTLGSDTASFSIKTNGSWFTYSCDTQTKYTGTGGTGGSGGNPGGPGTPTNPGGNGTCDATTSGPCSVASLKNTCFGNNAETISRLCNKESKGDPGSKSGVDICSNYGNRSFSGGLFQINVFANGSKLGDARCNNLGSKGTCANRRSSDGVCLGWNCQINNLSDFDHCMGLTLSADPNIKVACSLSSNGSNLTPWACSANKCGLGGTSSNFCK
jgi:hypothetical protein